MLTRTKRLFRHLLFRMGYDLHRVRDEPYQLLLPETRLELRFRHVLASYLYHQNPSDFFFIQVGAFDGVRCDPIHAFVQRHRWSGVLLEPRAEAFARLVETYRGQPQLQLLNAAISDRPGRRTLYSFDTQDLPDWSEGVASFDRGVLAKHEHEAGMPVLGSRIREEEVECVTFEQILEPLHWPKVDLLQVDAEGYDAHVVDLVPFERGKPAIIHFECKHLSKAELQACLERLASLGYVFARDGFEDMIACLAVIEA